jgi:hypothetical protein
MLRGNWRRRKEDLHLHVVPAGLSSGLVAAAAEAVEAALAGLVAAEAAQGREDAAIRIITYRRQR